MGAGLGSFDSAGLSSEKRLLKSPAALLLRGVRAGEWSGRIAVQMELADDLIISLFRNEPPIESSKL